MRNLVLLGSTGSIGRQTLELVASTDCKVLALSCNKSIELFERQIAKHQPRFIAIADPEAAKRLKIGESVEQVFVGEDAAEQLTRLEALRKGDIVLNAVVGIAGLKATLSALENGIDVALANKESLVTGGRLVVDAASRSGARLIPVDSEHSAIFQCLAAPGERKNLKKIWLTASGGPFFGKTKEELSDITPNEALRHPNWSMGQKITIDSATLMNKGLEIIEAAFLFDLAPDQISVVVHRQSIVHSMVEFCDGALLAQLGVPDMAVPIAYALTYPKRVKGVAEVPDILSMSLDFAPPDEEAFPCLAAAKKALGIGGLAPCIVNGANEAAVELFLAEKISFNDIGRLVFGSLKVVDQVGQKDTFEISDVLYADRLAREFVFQNR